MNLKVVLGTFPKAFLLMVIIKKFLNIEKEQRLYVLDLWILILDPGNINEEAFKLIRDNHGLDKTYILPDYTCNKCVADDSNNTYLKLVI